MNFYEKLHSSVIAHKHCVETCNVEWAERHLETVESLVKRYAPSGSGFDVGTKLLIDECKPELVVFETSFHHMDDHGGYDGWTEHRVYVRPSFTGVNVRVSGRDRNQIKDYIAEQFMRLNSLVVPTNPL